MAVASPSEQVGQKRLRPRDIDAGNVVTGEDPVEAPRKLRDSPRAPSCPMVLYRSRRQEDLVKHGDKASDDLAGIDVNSENQERSLATERCSPRRTRSTRCNRPAQRLSAPPRLGGRLHRSGWGSPQAQRPSAQRAARESPALAAAGKLLAAGRRTPGDVGGW